jgi:hypothetical protein
MATIDRKIAVAGRKADGAKKGRPGAKGWNSRRRQRRANKRGARAKAIKLIRQERI